MSQDQGAGGVGEELLFLSNKQLDDEKLSLQFGSTSSLARSSQCILVDKNPLFEFRDISSVTTGKKIGCSRLADIELERRLIVPEQQSSQCGLLSCPYCNEKKVNNSSIFVHDDAVGVRSTDLQDMHESRSAQLFSSEILAAHCAIKGPKHWHVHGSSDLCPVASQDYQQYNTRPLSMQCISLTSSCLSKYDEEQQKESLISSVPSSKCVGDHLFSSPRFQNAPQPLVVSVNRPQNQHHKLHPKSLGSRSASWSKDGNRANSSEEPEKLGAALCYSQTRARNAEKIATEVLQEKEKLAKLFIKEANTCRVYRRRVHLLELENLWLKKHSEEGELSGYFNASGLRYSNFYKMGSSQGGPSVPGSFGLAFALGLSCASAGFIMIGCCMALLGLSH